MADDEDGSGGDDLNSLLLSLYDPSPLTSVAPVAPAAPARAASAGAAARTIPARPAAGLVPTPTRAASQGGANGEAGTSGGGPQESRPQIGAALRGHPSPAPTAAGPAPRDAGAAAPALLGLKSRLGGPPSAPHTLSDTTTSFAPGIAGEKHSGLAIKNRLVSSAVLDEHFREMAVLKLARAASGGAASLPAGTPWATVGVLVDKGISRQTANGRNFMRWTLSDLAGASLTLFVFGDAYGMHWRSEPGALFAVLRPKLAPPKEDGSRGGGSGAGAISVDDGAMLMRLGDCPDYGTCKGTRRDGTPCSMPVNARAPAGAYCVFHAPAAFKALQAGANGAGRSGKAGAARPGANGSSGSGSMFGMYGGGGRAPGSGIHVPRQELFPSRRLSQALLPKPPVPLAKPFSSQTDLLARQQKRFVTTESLREMAAGVGDRPPTHGQRVLQTLVAVEMAEAKRLSAKVGQRVAGGGGRQTPASAPVPPVGRPAACSTLMLLDDDGDDGDDSHRPPAPLLGGAAARAAAAIKARGGLVAPNPNGVGWRGVIGTAAASKSMPTPLLLQATAPPLLGCPPAAACATSAAPAAPAAPAAFHAPAAAGKRNFLDAFASVASAKDPAAAEAGSMHTELAAAQQDDRILRSIQSLEARDELATKMQAVAELPVTAFRCKTCGLLAEYLVAECRTAGHTIVKQKVTKRFFICSSCKKGCTTLDSRYPARPCAKCGSSTFDRGSMYKGPTALAADATPGVAGREALLTRGVEHAFSLKQA